MTRLLSTVVILVLSVQLVSGQDRYAGYTKDQQLVIAAFDLDVEKMKQLLAAGADANARMGKHPDEVFQDSNGRSPVAASRWRQSPAFA